MDDSIGLRYDIDMAQDLLASSQIRQSQPSGVSLTQSVENTSALLRAHDHAERNSSADCDTSVSSARGRDIPPTLVSWLEAHDRFERDLSLKYSAHEAQKPTELESGFVGGDVRYRVYEDSGLPLSRSSSHASQRSVPGLSMDSASVTPSTVNTISTTRLAKRQVYGLVDRDPELPISGRGSDDNASTNLSTGDSFCLTSGTGRWMKRSSPDSAKKYDKQEDSGKNKAPVLSYGKDYLDYLKARAIVGFKNGPLSNTPSTRPQSFHAGMANPYYPTVHGAFPREYGPPPAPSAYRDRPAYGWPNPPPLSVFPLGSSEDHRLFSLQRQQRAHELSRAHAAHQAQAELTPVSSASYSSRRPISYFPDQPSPAETKDDTLSSDSGVGSGLFTPMSLLSVSESLSSPLTIALEQKTQPTAHHMGTSIIPEEWRYASGRNESLVTCGSIGEQSLGNTDADSRTFTTRGYVSHILPNSNQGEPPPSMTLASHMGAGIVASHKEHRHSNVVVESSALDDTDTDDSEAPLEEGEIFQCTFPHCGKSFDAKTWKRHEETEHLPQDQWTCLSTGFVVPVPPLPRAAWDVPLPFLEGDGDTMCAFCHQRNPDRCLHLQECPHRLIDCLTRPDAERTFHRKDNLYQHLRNFHRMSPANTSFGADWKQKFELAGRSWGCGFCGERLDSWERRARHLRAHFRGGRKVETHWDERKARAQPEGQNYSQVLRHRPDEPHPAPRKHIERGSSIDGVLSSEDQIDTMKDAMEDVRGMEKGHSEDNNVVRPNLSGTFAAVAKWPDRLRELPSISGIGNSLLDIENSSFPSGYVAPLRAWFNSNRHYPYPPKQTKLDLARRSGLSLKQVNAWFINARKKCLPRSPSRIPPKPAPTSPKSPDSQTDKPSQLVTDFEGSQLTHEPIRAFDSPGESAQPTVLMIDLPDDQIVTDVDRSGSHGPKQTLSRLTRANTSNSNSPAIVDKEPDLSKKVPGLLEANADSSPQSEEAPVKDNMDSISPGSMAYLESEEEGYGSSSTTASALSMTEGDRVSARRRQQMIDTVVSDVLSMFEIGAKDAIQPSSGSSSAVSDTAEDAAEAGGRSPSCARDGAGGSHYGSSTSKSKRQCHLTRQGDEPAVDRNAACESDSERILSHGKSRAKIANSPARLFACPYFKRDPATYRGERSCCGPGWPDVHRLKGHLFRRHRVYPCPRCWNEYKTENECNDHLREADRCVEVLRPAELVGFDASQETLLRSKSNLPPGEEERWRRVYRVLFPDDGDTPSPYYEELSVAPSSAAFDQFDQFLAVVLPQVLRRSLQASLEADLLPVEESLRRRAIENVQSLTERIFGLWRERRSGAGAPPEGAGMGLHPIQVSQEDISRLVTSTPALVLCESASTSSILDAPGPATIPELGDLHGVVSAYVPPPEASPESLPLISSVRGMSHAASGDSGYSSSLRASSWAAGSGQEPTTDTYFEQYLETQEGDHTLPKDDIVSTL